MSLDNLRFQKSVAPEAPHTLQKPALHSVFPTSPELASSSWVSPDFTWAVASNGAKGKENIESKESYPKQNNPIKQE